MIQKNLNSIRSRRDMLIYLNQEIKKQITLLKSEILDLPNSGQSAEWTAYKKGDCEGRILDLQRLESQIADFQKNETPLGILTYRRKDFKDEPRLAASRKIWHILNIVSQNDFPFHEYNVNKQNNFEYSYDMHGTMITKIYQVLAEF